MDEEEDVYRDRQSNGFGQGWREGIKETGMEMWSNQVVMEWIVDNIRTCHLERGLMKCVHTYLT